MPPPSRSLDLYTTAPPPARRRSTALERRALAALLRSAGRPAFAARLWDGMEAYEGQGTPVATLVVRHPRALRRLLVNPGLHFGDEYSAGGLDVDGDLGAFLEAYYRAETALQPRSWLQRHAVSRPRWLRRNTAPRSRANARRHYDLGNDFYALWLDPEMAYTCAYYPSPEATLEEAQRAKFELVCRKLRLQPGDRVVEAGCGWGGLARYMAREYGVSVRAYNVSAEQVRWARDRTRAEGLQDRVEFVEDDYRSISGRYPVFVSIGMMEHVGPASHQELGRVIDACLTPDGRGLVHTIGQNRRGPSNEWLTTRIFPGGSIPALAEITDMLEPWGFTVVDVENLRPHYARTCRDWLARFEVHAERVARDYGPSFVRAWRLYLTASMAGFTTGSTQLFQVLFTRPGVTDLPWTRAYMAPDSPTSKEGLGPC